MQTLRLGLGGRKTWERTGIEPPQICGAVDRTTPLEPQGFRLEWECTDILIPSPPFLRPWEAQIAAPSDLFPGRARARAGTAITGTTGKRGWERAWVLSQELCKMTEGSSRACAGTRNRYPECVLDAGFDTECEDGTARVPT